MLLVILKAVVEAARGRGGGWEGGNNNKHLTTQKGEDCRWEVLPEDSAGADQVKNEPRPAETDVQRLRGSF